MNMTAYRGVLSRFARSLHLSVTYRLSLFDPAVFARKGAASFLSALLIFQPVLVRAQVAADTSAPRGNQPGVGSAPNGVPLVDIVTPNATGLSHNKYHDLNVGTPGLILNNQNSEFGTSKLGGVTPGNPNLKNSGPASVILNEVTSSNRSSLLGPMEVFGGRADVIVANPNGITCSGCGFINTPHATLTTGTPEIDAQGRLKGFYVQKGDVTFGEKGGNFASGDGAVDLFDIVSKRIQIDGPVDAKHLRLSAGHHKFDYTSGEATAVEGLEDEAEFAIDGSALGAMQADRIKVVVTDKGAGVRMRSDMAANAGDLTLSADGKISLGHVSGHDGVSIQSKSNKVEARAVTSKKKIVVKADKGITLQTVAADEDVTLSGGYGLITIEEDATSLGNLAIDTADGVTAGNLSAGQNIAVAAGQTIAAGNIIANGATRLTSSSGNIALSGIAKAGGGDLSLVASSGFIHAGSLISFKNTSLSAGRDIVAKDAILSGGALVASSSSLTATSAVSGVDFAASQSTSDGTIVLGNSGMMQLDVGGGVIDVATLLAAGDLTTSASKLSAQSITSHGAVTMVGDLSVKGQILAAGDVWIAGQSIDAGTIISGVDYAASKASSNGDVVLGAAGNIVLNALSGSTSGVVTSSNGGTIVVGSLLSAGSITAQAASFTANTITSHGSTRIEASTNISGQVLAGQSISITGPAITLGAAVAGVDLNSLNKGQIVLSNNAYDLTLNATAGNLIASQLQASGSVTGKATGNLSANVVAHGALTLDAGQLLTLTSQSLSGGDATLTAQSMQIDTLVSGVDFAPTAQAGGALILNTGEGQSGKLTLAATNGAINAGQLVSARDLHASASQDITYNSLNSFANLSLSSDHGSISIDHDTVAKGDIALSLQHLDLSNNRSKLATAGTLTVHATDANLANSTLTFGGVALNLTGSADATNTRLGAVNANGGSGTIAINAASLVTNYTTTILAAKDLTLNLGTLTNSGQLAAQNDLAFNITGDLTNTATGLIYAGRDGRLFVDGNIANVQGAIFTGRDLTFANYAGTGKNISLLNKAGLIQSGRNLSIQTQYLLNEANGEPVIGEREGDGTRYSFATPDHYDELWDNDTLMKGKLFYDPAEGVPWGRGACSGKHGDPCDVTWLDKGIWQTKEETYGYVTMPDGTVYKAFTWDKAGSNDGKGKIWYDWNDQAAMSEQSQTQYFISKPTTQGLIQANGDLTINATTIDNFYSSIEAGGDADITSDVVTNKGVTLYKDVYMTCMAGAETCYGYNADGSRNASADISANSSVFLRHEAVDSLSSVIRSGGKLTLNVGTLNNSAAEGSIAGYSHYEAATSQGDPLDALKGLSAGGALFKPKLDLDSLSGPHVDQALIDSIRSGTGLSAPKPNSGGFGGTVPNQNFIYETRAEFLDVSRFYGSGYYLNRIGYQPDHQVLFLGDAYFENQLIDKQMRDATGRGLGSASFIPGTDPIDQMKGLLDNGVSYSQEHGLGFGEPLSAEQIAALDESVVVYVKQNVGGVEVFAPVLYVAAKDKESIVSAGSMVEGGSVVVAGDQINNSGLIASNSGLQINANTISANGGGFAATGNVVLAATGDINLNAGTTTFNGSSVVVPTKAVSAGGSANIHSDKDVNLNGVNVKAGDSLDVRGANVNIGVASTSTANGSQNVTGSSLSAGSDVTVSARNDVNVTGSKIDAGNNLAISAEQGNLTIQSAQADHKDGFGETSSQQKSALSSGGSTSLDAEKNIVIAGSDVKAGTSLSVEAGEGVAIIATQEKSKGTFGSNSFDTTTQQGSSLTSGGDTSVKAGTDILIGASNVKAGGNVGLEAKGDVNIIAQANSNDEQTRGKIFNRDEKSTTAVGSSISGGGNVTVAAGTDGAAKDINIIGSSIEAGGKAELNATNNVNILAAEDSHELHSTFSEKSSGPFGKSRSWTKDEAETTAKGSSISGGTGVDISSGNNTTIAASKITAGNDNQKADLNIKAGGDLIIASGKDTAEADGSKSKSGFISKKNDKSHSYNETTVASELGASGNVNLNADKNVVIAGSKVKAGDSIAIEGDSVSVIGAQERHEHETSSKKSGLGVGSGDGFYSVYGKHEKTSSETIVANVGSELSAGQDVSIKARGSDINIVGSKVEAKNDIALDAARDVNILPGAESYQSSEKEKRSGFGVQVKTGEGSASIGIGYGSSKDETHQGSETNAVSTLKAGHDLKINAGRDANLQAAKVEADHDVAITAERDVNLLSAQDKTNYEHMHEDLFAGVTAQVSTGVVGAAKSIGSAAEKIGKVSDGYSAANAGFAGLKAIDGASNLTSMVTLDENGNAKGNVASASVGVGFEYSKSKEKNESSTPVTTDIRAGNNINIEAKSGDINSHGSQIAAGYDQYGLPSGGDGNITLKAGNDVNLQSAEATNSSSSSSTSAGASVGVSAGVSLTGVSSGVTASAHGGVGKSKGNGTTQVNTHVDGTGDIKIESGRDTNLKGAVVTGETITADVGRDLNIISQKDTGESSNKSASLGVSTSGVSPGFGTGSGETNWIDEQSGLVSKGKMDVTVEGNTHLGAGKIISENGDLTLDTGTLTHEDFSGSKQYEGFDVQANIGLTGTQQPDQTSQPNVSGEGTYQLDDTRQEVRSTVGPGNIIIRDKDKQAELEASGQTAALDDLNRDPDKAYEITKDKHVEIEFYLSDTSVKKALQAGQTIAETFGDVLDQMVKDGKRTPEQAALSKEMFPFLDDPNVQAQLEQCGQRHGSLELNIFDWIVPSAHAQTACPVMMPNGQVKYFTPGQAADCIADYREMTGIVRGIIGSTGATVGALAGAFLLASTTAAGTDVNQKFTADDGSTVVVTGKGDQPIRLIVVTYPDGTTANLTIETYDDGGAVRLTGGMIGTQPMTPNMLQDMGDVLTNAGLPNVVMSEDANSTLPDSLLGHNGQPGGKRINTDLPGVNPTPDELFDKLTGGKNTVLPDGTKVGDNGVRLRPDKGEGPRLDIPANGDKPHETIHFPSK